MREFFWGMAAGGTVATVIWFFTSLYEYLADQQLLREEFGGLQDDEADDLGQC